MKGRKGEGKGEMKREGMTGKEVRCMSDIGEKHTQAHIPN